MKLTEAQIAEAQRVAKHGCNKDWILGMYRDSMELNAQRERIKALEECRNTLAIVYGERGDLNTDQWAVVAHVLAAIAALDKDE